MITARRHGQLAATYCCGMLFLASALLAAEQLQFNRDIRPILSDRCFKCHGPDKAARKASLRLDLPEEAFAERKKSHKFAIVPGKPEQSLVVGKIFATNQDDLMPPPESNLSLNPNERQTIRRWIAEGAHYQPHWAFIPLPDSVPVPRIKDKKWPRNEIDRFILARLEKASLKPSPEASRTRWLRRVTYDLIGLPPKPEEVDAFLEDKSAAAYENVVDRLLASKHFGERMAVPWLDAARYADSYGYQSDQLCPTWPFRDWVVKAFNENMPYNEFLTEQLAGDLLPHPTRQQRLATAFNRLHRQTNEGGSIEEEWRTEYVSDRVHTLSTAMMALTMECTHCHDHKYDPLTQRDYYSLAAFFNSIDEYGTYNDSAHVPTPSLLLPTADQEQAMNRTEKQLQDAMARLAKAAQEAEPTFQEWLKKSPSLQTNSINSINPNDSANPSRLLGQTACFSFDGSTNRFANLLNPTNLASLGGNTLTAGHSGQPIKFNGDDEITFTGAGGALQTWDQYTLVFWLKLPEALTNGVIFHRCQGTDTGFHGTELDLDAGRLFFVIKRFWPGNALAIRATEPLPTRQWIQVGVSYDGSARAEGMRLFLNGKTIACEVVRNHLYKDPESGGNGVSFGALFRSTGLKDGLLDDLQVFNRPLAAIEVHQLFDGHALDEALANGDPVALRPYYLAAVSELTRQSRTDLSQAVHEFFMVRRPVAETSVMEEMAEPRPAYVLARGRYDALKTEANKVTRATPAFLPALHQPGSTSVPSPRQERAELAGEDAGAPRHPVSDARPGRLDLAHWLTEPHHPLTARVAVNRIWQMLFGRGLVATAENFGSQGAEPSHPELLDWLARDFISSGWDVEAMLKKIVLSATYRQDSRLRPDLQQTDADNILLARGPSQRLPAEMIRDTALAASGLLDETMGGPPVSPYQPGDLWRESNSMSPAYRQSVGRDLYRRSLYTVWKRTAPMPDMTAFDAPSREVCTVRRNATATPQQAFVLLNDIQFVEAARVLAEAALKSETRNSKPETGNSEAVRFIFRRLTARDPDAKEIALLMDLWKEQLDVFEKEPKRAEALIAVGESKRDQTLDPVRLAATTVMAQAILNMDATVWKR